jgi:putative transposase
MASPEPYAGRNDHLKRLPREYYRGYAYVHWIITTEDRKAGWVSPLLHCQFRELLTHTVFRYALACPIYCLMPDHMHVLWIGISEKSDQILAMKYFRRHVSAALTVRDIALHYQSYDHVLRENELQEDAFVAIVEYIARNPERKQLVGVDEYRNYPYTSCLMPGYPELTLWAPDFWERFWRTCSFLRTHGLFRAYDEQARPQ